jgi:UDPglucose 6-dehydrogenase
MPGTTDRLAEKFSLERIAFQPEFLSADTALEDFAHQGYAVIGTRSGTVCGQLARLLSPFANRFMVMEPTEAEILKLAQNSFYALKVTFANEIADLCEQYGVRYEPVRDALYASPFIAGNHLDVGHKGYRGYGGACLPKDEAMLRRSGHCPLLERAHELNEARCSD